jgi:predicted transcriptional regulator YdeE
MTSETEFDYWALMPLGKGAKIPAGLTEFTVPGGPYAECPVASLAEMGGAYGYLYGTWGTTRQDCSVNFHLPSFELYNNEEYLNKGSLILYVPITKK